MTNMQQPRYQKDQTRYTAEFSQELVSENEEKNDDFVREAINRAYSQFSERDDFDQSKVR